MPRVSFGLSVNAFALVGLEPGEFDPQIVGAGKQAGEQVLSAIVADGGLHRLRPGVRDRDGRARQHAAARVLDVAADRGGR